MEHQRQHQNVPTSSRRKPRRKPRRWWVRPWLTEQQRQTKGQYHQLLKRELSINDRQSFINYLRMPVDLFNEIVHKVTPLIQTQTTNWRDPLPTALKVAITLRHLATGDSYPSLSFNFRCGKTSITRIIPQVCRAIVECYRDETFKLPVCPDDWKRLAAEFEERWQVPHAVGALDGKHIAVKKPNGSGSLYHNYKGFFSIPLMALVDAQYKFIWIELGGMGHMSDAQIYNDCELSKSLEENTVGLPAAEPLPNDPDGEPMPYFILADDAFALRTYLMKPYSRRGLDEAEKHTNYRLSRGRMVVEQAFGILANRFRVLHRTMEQQPERVRDLLEAMCVLHNLFRIRLPHQQPLMIDADINTPVRRTIIHDVPQPPNRGYGHNAAKRQRDYLKYYFCGPGQLQSQ